MEEEIESYDVVPVSDNCNAIVDVDTGEIITLQVINEDEPIDVDGAVNWAADKVADIEAKAEIGKRHIQFLRDKLARDEKSIKRIKSWLAVVVGAKKVDTGIHQVGRFRHWENMVNITDSKQIPDTLKKERIYKEPNNAAIKEMLLAGRDVPGAELTEYWSCSFDGGKKKDGAVR